MHLYISIVASHLGTLDVHVREARGVGAGPQDGVLQGLDSINTNLVLPPGKPQCVTY